MRTKGFELFLSQYHSQGREKLDGYTLSNLDELSSEERLQALKMLVEEAPKFNGAYEPLAYLDKNVAIDVLKRIEEAFPQNEFRGAYVVYYWLYKLTGNNDFAQKFCESRKYLLEKIYATSVINFYSLASEIVYSPIVESMLRSAIFFESHDVGLSTVARTLLNRYGYSRDIPERKEQYLAMWRTLTEGGAEQKQAVLDSLG